MTKIALNCFIVFATVLVVIPLIHGAGKWKLVWREEFNGPSLNLKNWIVSDNGGFPEELEYYSPKNVLIENGNLVICIKKERKDSYDFTSGNISTSQSWKYGKFDIRARLPKGKHLWPAFWLLPKPLLAYGRWPSSGEIDIMEARGEQSSRLEGTLHYGKSPDNKNASTSGSVDFKMDFSQAFHNFGFEWDSNVMKWLIDGTPYHSVNMKQNFWPGFYTKDGQPFDQKFALILNVAVGGGFFEKNNFTTSDADKWEKPRTEVDYVRVYQPA